MMQLIPSITIHGGQVVYRKRNQPAGEKIYPENPLDLATQFAEHGVEVIHFVDLDGALRESPKHYDILKLLKAHVPLQYDFTGGIRTDGDVNKAFEHGADYITAASVAVLKPELFASWIISYGREKMTLGADIVDSKTHALSYRGWQANAGKNFFELVEFFYERGLKYVKSTDIAREDNEEEPNFKFYEQVKKTFPDLQLIASGAVRSVDDILRFQDLGMFAVILGRAFYEGTVTLKDLDKLLSKK